jgi:uncharacterized membrane protein
MSRRGRRILWALIIGGVALRVVLAFSTVGIAYDIESFRRAAAALFDGRPFSLYLDVNTPIPRWPYPSGLFPWLAVAYQLAKHTFLPFHGLVQLPAIAGDGLLTWVVQAYLGDRGKSERTRLIAAALVALGPSFIFVSGWEGQLDAAAIAPAALGLLLWGRLPPGRRAITAGLLIGLGAAIKTVPIVVVLALLPKVSSRREAALLLGTAVALPVLAMAPWLLAQPHATNEALRYTGLPGIGGLTLLVQPSIADSWLLGTQHQLSGLSNTLLDIRGPLLALSVAAMAVYLVRRKPEPAQGALLAWLAVYVLSVNFGPRYLVWALPFALMAGYLWEVGILQAIGFPAALIIGTRPHPSLDWLPTVYVVLMFTLLLAFAAWLVLLVARPRPAPA